MKELNSIIKELNKQYESENSSIKMKETVSNTFKIIDKLGSDFIKNLIEFESKNDSISFIWMNDINDIVYIIINNIEICYFFESKFDKSIYHNHIKITDDSILEFSEFVKKLNRN